MPRTAVEAGEAISPGSVLVMDHKASDFEGDHRARFSDHLVTVPDALVSSVSTNLLTFATRDAGVVEDRPPSRSGGAAPE